MIPVDLGGKIAIVTGATSRIGTATAELLAAKGAAVACFDHDSAVDQTARRLVEFGRNAQGYICSTVPEDVVRGVVADVARTLGPPTILVNVIDAWPDGNLIATHADDIQITMEANQLGPLWMARSVWQHMVDAGDGVIVNVSATQYGKNAVADVVQSALQTLTVALAAEGRQHGIRVNCVTPELAVEESRNGWDEMPEKVADTVATLCSPRTSHVTAAVLPVVSSKGCSGFVPPPEERLFLDPSRND